MANSARSILSVSYDESLLRTREWILETAGFKVTSAVDFSEAMNHCKSRRFDLVIIGHSIPPDEKRALIEAVTRQNHARLLVLRMPGDERVAGAYSLMASEGPEALIAAVKTALATDDGSSTSAT